MPKEARTVSQTSFSLNKPGCNYCQETVEPAVILKLNKNKALVQNEVGHCFEVLTDLLDATQTGEVLLVDAGVALERILPASAEIHSIQEAMRSS